jgi:4-amino-4-deoxy-L-arabinose transferase-like glycosyltransferase
MLSKNQKKVVKLSGGKNKYSLPFHWKRSHIILLILLTFIGIYLRIEPVFFDTVHFSYDQGVDISYVRNLVEDHKLRLIGRFTGLEGIFMGPLWTWVLTIPYLISGGNPSANIIFLAILGILAIWYSYAIIRLILNERTGLIVAFFVAVTGPFIGASQVVISPSPLTILQIFHLWFLWELVSNKKKQYLLWLGFLIGIFFQLEIGYAAFLLIATMVTLIIMGEGRLLWKKEGLLSLTLLASTFIPQILFEIRHEFLMSKAFLRFLLGQNTSLGSQGAGLLDRAFIRIGSLWEDYTSSVAFGGRDVLMGILVSLPAIAGWKKIIERKEKKQLQFGKLLLILVISMYIGFTIFPAPVWVWYRAGLPIIFILLVAIGFEKLMQEIKAFRWIAGLGLSLVFIVRFVPNSLTAKVVKGYEGGPATLRNQKKSLEFIHQDAGEQPFDLYVYTPPVYTYVWDHMLFWYAYPRYSNQPQDYGYQRSSKAENDFYLLIEPDEYQDRINGWKGNFVAFGKPMAVWDLRGGIKIEKWKTDTQRQ